MAKYLLSKIRIEEWILIGLWIVYAILCLSTGTGMNFDLVLIKYMKYFSIYIVWLFVITRLLIPLADGWRPTKPILQKAKIFLFQKDFNRDEGRKVLISSDTEIIRGCFILFASLSCYSNLKQRIPAVNDIIGDQFFANLDSLLIGDKFAPWLVQYTKENRWLRDFLADTYMHGYFWMIVLLLLAYLRRDKLAIRWVFCSVAGTYLVALLITVCYPSYGLFFLEPQNYEWINGGIERSQKMLMKTYNNNLTNLKVGSDITARTFAGIAAFPSLHMGHMIILFLISLKIFRIYAVVIAFVTFFTFLATIAFGWHYAVDAIGGFAVASFVTFSMHRFIYKKNLLRSWNSPDTTTAAENEAKV